jgi:predicted ester cyclase
MSIESTREIVIRYLNAAHGDTSMLADDVVFTTMDDGREAHTPQGVLAMLHYLYQVAFEATAESRNLVVGDGNAVLEADFTGKHIGEFAGIQPTGKSVRVPLCVCYDIEGEQIKRARIYFQTASLLGQLQS